MFKVIIGSSVMLVALTACGYGNAQTETPTKTYCLEEQERDGYDYMVVADMKVCDGAIDDVELFETNSLLNIGDVAYVEADGSHSKNKIKLKSEVKHPSNPPAFIPKTAPTKICKIAYKPAPAPPKPAPNPAPAPVVPKPVAPAPVAPKPPVATVLPKPATPAPTAPKAVPVPTVKPGC